MIHHAAWGAAHGTRFIVAIRESIVKHFPIDSLNDADALAQALDADGWDVYFAPSQFTGEARKASEATVVPALWIDLDAGPGKLHESQESALESLLGWVTSHSLPLPTHIVQSGSGFHIYWMLDAPVPLAQWQPVSQQFKRALAAERVADDLGCTTDAARILRVPGTHNHKQGAHAPVRLVYETDRRVRLDDIRSALPELGPQRSRVPDEWTVATPLPPGDATVIETQCAQMRRIKAEGGKVPEPLWRAALSVLWRCEGGEKLIHDWSRGDPRYDATQTERKARATAGPATCEHFDELDPERCTGCPWRGKVTSPVQISLAAPAPVEQSPAESWRRSRVGKFIITSGGVWLNRDDDKPKRVTMVPVWVVEVRERAKREPSEADEASLYLEWVSVDGRTKRARLFQRTLYASDQQLKSWAGAENLAAAVVDWKAFVMFISQYTLDALRQDGARQYHESLGWHSDGFVIGDRRVTASGVQPCLIQTSNPVGKVQASGGTVEGWVQAIEVLNKPIYRAHQFTIQAGFASALLEPCGLHSAVVSLTGPPGTGKTLSANAALSIYGNPEYLRQGAKSSIKAMEKQLGANCNVPFLIDEITQWTPVQAGAICYMAANGMGDSKLTRTRENFDVLHWRLTPIVTSNRPLLDYSQTQFTDAHRARLVELYMGEVMPRADGGVLAHAVERDHYGTAAVPYLQWVCANCDEIKPLVKDAIARLSEQYSISDAHRFGVWTLAASWVAGCIAQRLGLIGWNPWKPVRLAAHELLKACDDIRTAGEIARDLVQEWLTEHNDRVVTWERHDRLKTTLVHDPVARVIPSEGAIALHRGKVRHLLADAGVPRRACDELFGPDKLIAEQRLNLVPGSTPVWVYLVGYETVGYEP